jgi:hypothetical protein
MESERVPAPRFVGDPWTRSVQLRSLQPKSRRGYALTGIVILVIATITSDTRSRVAFANYPYRNSYHELPTPNNLNRPRHMGVAGGLGTTYSTA